MVTPKDRQTFYDSTGYMGTDLEITYWIEKQGDAIQKAIAEQSTGMKYDNGKLLYSLIPPIATKALAEVLTFGANKYAPNSWQTVPDAERRYLDASMRHLEAYRSGKPIDTESKLPHLWHLLCNVAFLVHFENERLNKGN
jgi:hypothetical protein